MRILLAPLGTLGDIKPLIAYAVHLKAAGARPAIFASKDWEKLAADNALEFFSCDINFKELALRNQDIVGKPFKSILRFFKNIKTLTEAPFPELLKQAKRFDCLVGAGVQLAAFSVAEYYKIPYFHLLHCPVWLESARHTSAIFPCQTKSPRINKLSWQIFKTFLQISAGPLLKKQRKMLGLPALRNIYDRLSSAVIIACDSNLATIPADCRFARQIPYITLKESGQLPAQVQVFLRTGPPPVFLGFGSMPHLKKGRIIQIFLSIVKELGLRAIIQQAELMVEKIDENVLLIGDLSHQELFPRTRLIVHHGGAGTFFSAARAGVVQIIIPHIADQYYWAARSATLGLGPPVVRVRRLDYAKFKKIIVDALANDFYRRRAQKVAARMSGDEQLAILDDMLGVKKNYAE